MNAFLLAAFLLPYSEPPPLSDLTLLPSSQTVREARHFNLAYRRHLELRMTVEVYRADELAAAYREAEAIYHIWDVLDDVQMHDDGHVYGDECWRRERLRHLRELLGRDAYYRGELPPCVPVWRFQVMR